MINSSTNRPAPLMQDMLNLTFGDIQWAICYPDGSFAIGLTSKNCSFSELYGRAMASARAEVLKFMEYIVIDHGWMKPRGVKAAGPVVVFRLPEVVSHA